MDFLITPLKDLVTEKGRFLLQDHRTLSFLCRQVLIQEGKAILDLDDVLVIEGARVILRVLPKNNKIDLCPSFMKGHGRNFKPDKFQEYLNTFDYICLCFVEQESIKFKLVLIPNKSNRFLNIEREVN